MDKAESLPVNNAELENEQPALADKEHGFLGHPWGLANLSGIELWERFSFYGMQALVGYYIYYATTDGGLGYTETEATSIIGAYGGLVYLSAIFGSWVSDRLFGAERTLTGAAILIMFGHIALAVIPGMTGVGVGLICVAFGSGALKATTSTVVAAMYRRLDPRRDAAFSIYYMAVNIGAFLGPLLTGFVWKNANFHWGFALAAIGIATGLIQYLIMRRKTLVGIDHGAPNPASKSEIIRVAIAAAVVVAAVTVAALTGVLNLENISTFMTGVTLLAAVLLFAVMLRSPLVNAVERSRVIAFIPLFLACCGFWALYMQQFTSIAVLSDKQLDRVVFGWEFPATWVQSISPLFIIIFAGVFSWIWMKLGERQITTPTKFAIANAIVGLAFIVFIPFTHSSIPLMVLVAVLLLFTVAELLLSPLGQSLATKLAPEAFSTQMIALFFLSIAVGTAASGRLSRYYNPEDPVATNHYFLLIGLISIGLGIVVALAAKPIVKLMKGVR